jgi:hypothetical protein
VDAYHGIIAKIFEEEINSLVIKNVKKVVKKGLMSLPMHNLFILM